MGDRTDRTEPRKLELLRRVVDRADRGEVFATDADVDAVLRDPELDARRRPRLASEIDDPLPDPILSLDGRGAVLTAGSVTILAGEGGRGKSSFAYGLAVEVAAVPESAGPAEVGPLKVHGGGPVLLVTYEDRPGLVAWALRRYAGKVRRELGPVHVLDLTGRPVFGPVAEPGKPALYNARPVRLPGWADLAGAVEAIRPRLIVVDPALSAFVGEPNAVGPVREFLGALGELAGDRAGVLLVSHSTKAARREGADPFDPGHVGGSSAWVDGVRGVLVLGAGETDALAQLACPKSNYGPARLLCGLQPITDEPSGHGRTLGFRLAPGGAGWHRPDLGRPSDNSGQRRRRPEKATGGYQHGKTESPPATV